MNKFKPGVRGGAEASSRTGSILTRCLAGLGVAAFVSFTSAAWAQQNVPLGTAAGFGVLGASTVTNTGPTVVTGSVGVWPGSSITGFPPGTIVPGSGTLHSADAVAQQAQADLTTAYSNAASRACGTPIPGGLLGGLVLAPGVYCMTTADLTGILTLSGLGVYVFQMATTLTTAPNASVVLTNGATACGVWWQVGSSATIDLNSALAGNVLALASITVNGGATVNGRTLAQNAAVTLDTNAITVCDVLAAATLITQASPTVQLAGAIDDTATLGGGIGPTGSITFNLYGPNNATCSGAPVFTSTVPIAGNGSYPSASFTPASTGTYRWIANYSGDANNTATANACNAANESSAVTLLLIIEEIPTVGTGALLLLALLLAVSGSLAVANGGHRWRYRLIGRGR